MKVRRLPPLLVKSKMRGKAVLHTTFEGHRDRVPSSGDIHSYGLGDGPPRLNQQTLSWPALASLFSHTGQPAEASARLVLVMPFAESGVCSEGRANNAPTALTVASERPFSCTQPRHATCLWGNSGRHVSVLL